MQDEKSSAPRERVKVVIHNNTRILAKQVAKIVADMIREKQGKVTLGLPTGSTPIRFAFHVDFRLFPLFIVLRHSSASIESWFECTRKRNSILAKLSPSTLMNTIQCRFDMHLALRFH